MSDVSWDSGLVFKARVGPDVFISTRAVVQEADVPANTFVPPYAFISQDHVSQLGETGPYERGFMEEVTKANLKLLEGYLRLQQREGANGGKDHPAETDIT